MQGIRGHIWFENCADEAVATYTELFPDSEIGDRLYYTEAGKEIHGQEPGSTLTVDFSIAGHRMVALNGGPFVQLNPSISLSVACPSPDEVDRLWNELARDGAELMPLDEYPWAKRYGWVQDRFGLSWQISFAGSDDRESTAVTPSLLFHGDVYGRAEEAMQHWTGIFPESSIGQVVHQEEGDAAGKVAWAEFTLAGERYNIMESELEHEFEFNGAFSFLIECEAQDEVDYYWSALTAGGTEGPCGWLNDRFGVSWQAAPIALQEMLRDGDPDQVRRVTDCFMKMKKLELPAIEAAYRGEGASEPMP